MVRLTVRGAGFAPICPDRKEIQKFWPIFFIEIWFFDTQNTFNLIVRGLKNAFFLLYALYCYLSMTMTAAVNSKEELGIQEVGWKWLRYFCLA